MPIDQQNELFYSVDVNDQVIGSVTRGRAHSSNKIIHRAVGIFIIDELEQMLMHKRSHKKDMDPGKWSYAVGGHVTFGQTYDEAAIREVEEELGIKTEPKFIIKTLVKMKKETEYTALYEVRVSSNLTIAIDKDEIEKITWVKLTKLADFINTHKVADWTLSALKTAQYV